MPVPMTASPILFQSQVVGAIVVFRDITKERAIDRAKTEFVSIVSHQLRTPLSAIRWNLELLLDEDFGPLKPEQQQYLKDIAMTNERMIKLVNALLNVSRLELGNLRGRTTTAQCGGDGAKPGGGIISRDYGQEVTGAASL